VVKRKNRIWGALTTRGRAFAAAGLTLLALGLLLGFPDVTRVGVLVCALPLLAAMILRRGGSNTAVSRTVDPAKLIAGQSAQVTVSIQNVSGRRSQLRLAQEQVPRELAGQARFVLPVLEPGEVREVSYQIHAQVRGQYQLGPLWLRKQDPYALVRVDASVPGSTNLLVLPRVESLSGGRPGVSGVGGESSIPHLLSVQDEDDVAVRSYRDGDDLRRIHWPTTAHRAELMVRQEDHPARRRAVILLDSRGTGHQGSRLTGSFEWAVSAATSMAAHLTDQHYTLHLASNETAAESRTMQTVTLDDAMASLAMARLGTAAHHEEVLRGAHPLTSPGGLLIALVTDHDEAVLRRTVALRQPEGTGLLVLLDTASFAQPRGAPPARRSRPPADRTVALAAQAAEAGWRTCVVVAGTSVGQAWTTLTGRPAATVAPVP